MRKAVAPAIPTALPFPFLHRASFRRRRVNPDLVARDEEGKPYTVRCEAVNAMLLNEFLKEHRKVEELEATVTQLQAAFKAQAAQIQKVERPASNTISCSSCRG